MSGIIGGAGSKSGIIGTTELDYEEGFFRLTAYGSSGSVGSYADNAGKGWYCKVGGAVFFSIMFTVTNRGNWSGSLNFSGLPFACSSQNHHNCSTGSLKFAASAADHGAYIGASSSHITVRKSSAYGEDGMSWSDIAGSLSDSWSFYGWYPTYDV